jgi:hypothetical protein
VEKMGDAWSVGAILSLLMDSANVLNLVNHLMRTGNAFTV